MSSLYWTAAPLVKQNKKTNISNKKTAHLKKEVTEYGIFCRNTDFLLKKRAYKKAQM